MRCRTGFQCEDDADVASQLFWHRRTGQCSGALRMRPYLDAAMARFQSTTWDDRQRLFMTELQPQIELDIYDDMYVIGQPDRHKSSKTRHNRVLREANRLPERCSVEAKTGFSDPTGLSWTESLPAATGRVSNPEVTALLRELKNRPGQWAKVYESKTQKDASNKAGQFKHRGAETANRKLEDRYCVFARWPESPRDKPAPGS